MKTLYTIFVITVFVIFVSACEKVLPNAPSDDEILDGPVAGLNSAQSAQFLRGDIAFNDEIFTSATGLGSIFVASSCGSCHAGDGKGHPSTTLTRFGQIDETGNNFLQQGGPQLQNRALPGFIPEQIPVGATSSKFTPPANTGLGFIELVSDADILAMADPLDTNGDGISGVPNYKVYPAYLKEFPNAIPQGDKYICRFGKKAGAYNLLHQTVNAYNQDMGITSSFEPLDVYSHQEIDPEVSNQTVNDVVFYLQTLKAPVQRNQQDAEVKYGQQVFINIGCENCHKQTLKTGTSPIAALSNQEFHPYTDLLLHDMGSGLDDGYTEGSAKTYEWRTPALWGLGLSPNSQGGKYFLLHDGRATSIEDAIIMHGGEGTSSKQKFEHLSPADRNALLNFLKSL
jgi:CxxC motif-containing protein (DUF1111 family)